MTVFLGKGGTWQSIVKPMDDAQDTWESVAQIHDVMTGEILHSTQTEEKKFSSPEIHGVARDGVVYLTGAKEPPRCRAWNPIQLLRKSKSKLLLRVETPA